LLVEKCAANRLVVGVVTADVFAHNFRFAVKIENGGGVDSTVAREFTLEFSQERRERKQDFDVDTHIFRRNNRRKILSNRVNSFFAANAKTARNRSESFC